MRSKLLVALVVFAAASCQTLRPKTKTRDPGAIEQVEFYIGGAFPPAPAYEVKSFHRANGTSVEPASRFRKLALRDDLEAGEYEYVLEPVDTAVHPASQHRLKGNVALWGPDNRITLQMPDDPIGGDFGEVFVTGRVRPSPQKHWLEPTWVRLQNVVAASQVRQAKVNADGSFRILARLLTGNFVVTVCRGDDVLYVEHIHLVRTHPDWLDIELPPQK